MVYVALVFGISLDFTISGFAENTPAREKLYLYIDLSVLFIVLNPN